MNRNLVFNVLRTGAVSRADVARATGLSPATVSAIVSELIDNGLVSEVGQGKSRGGRPPLVLRINDERNYAVGLKLMPNGIFLVITDIRAEVLYSEMAEIDWSPVSGDSTLSARGGGGGPESVLDRICLVIEGSAARAGVGMENVVGVGIALPGVVDSESGTCLYSPDFGWRDVPVSVPIARRLGRPVLTDNDVNALTVAEQWFGRGRGVDDFVVVYAGEYVGAGIVVEGIVYRGAGGAAGELGHLPVQGEPTTCRCGLQGCLETVSSDGAVRRSVAGAIEAGRATALVGLSPAQLTIEAVGAAAEAGDEVAAEAVQRAGRMLGLGIASVVNLLNPRLVILTGSQAGSSRWESAIIVVRERSFAGIDRDIDFFVDSVDDVDWARGAACIVLGELFSAPMYRNVELAPVRVRP
ncbi:MAG TPA: ROK family transcriptional regulator [Acidimicrobiales bacterium]|nr:ROK family transcriptional regulator [Acidimicrobiales bacterium]